MTFDDTRLTLAFPLLALGRPSQPERDYAANYQGDIFIKIQIRKFVVDCQKSWFLIRKGFAEDFKKKE